MAGMEHLLMRKKYSSFSLMKHYCVTRLAWQNLKQNFLARYVTPSYFKNSQKAELRFSMTNKLAAEEEMGGRWVEKGKVMGEASETDPYIFLCAHQHISAQRLQCHADNHSLK